MPVEHPAAGGVTAAPERLPARAAPDALAAAPDGRPGTVPASRTQCRARPAPDPWAAVPDEEGRV
ncbi:hypothetical protein [Streptomyces sp. SCL15-4]|uniref:hypothetical protein n=1 Tax=Streptomyces sp. SCL15-4 TaxID=2967221 RepID=UPI0029672FC1|nr:hypothetical protein [Streptomyces sp. SCL15-4]